MGPTPNSLPPGPPYGDGTPYGYGDAFGYGCAYAGAGYGCDSGVPGYGGSYGIGGGGFGLLSATSKPIRTNPNTQYISAMPGVAYSPETAVVLSDEWERQLGVSAGLIYRRMMLDPQVRSSFNYLLFAVLGDGPQITAALTETPGVEVSPEEQADVELAEEIAEFCRRQLKRIDRPIVEVAGQLLHAAAYKAMLAEIVEEYCEEGPDAGSRVLKSLPVRSPRSWSFVVNAVTSETVGYLAWTANGPQVIAAEHCEAFAWEPEAGDPRGVSLFEAAYSAWNEKVSLIPERFKHLTLFGSPSVHYELPEGIGMQDQLDANGNPDYSRPQISPTTQGMQQLSAFRAGGMICTFNGGKINLISGENDGGAFTKAKEDCNREIATAILLSPRSTMEAQHSSKADNEGAQDSTGFLIGRGKTRLAAVFRAILKRLVVANRGQEVADRLMPLVSFSAEHHDRNAIIEANVAAGWQADPSAFPAMDVQAGLQARPTVKTGEEEQDDELETESEDLADEEGQAEPPARFAGGVKKKRPATDGPTDEEHADALRFLRPIAESLGLADGYMDGTLTPEETRTLLHAVSLEAESLMRAEAEALVAALAPAEMAAFANPIKTFFAKAKKILKTAFLAAALVLNGPAPMAADERLIFAQQVVSQEAFLRNFQAEVVSGAQPPDGTLVARAGMYGQAAYAVGQNTNRGIMLLRGKAEGRRMLGAEDDRNCEECPPLAELGWMPVKDLVPIGSTVCRGNCRCWFEYRDAHGKPAAFTRPEPVAGKRFKSHHEGHEGGKKPHGHWVTHQGRHLFISGDGGDESRTSHHDEHHRELDEHAQRVGKEHGQDVRVDHSAPKTPAEHAALAKAMDKGGHLIETTSGPKHTIHTDEHTTRHEVGGVLRAEVTRSENGKHWVRREPTHSVHGPKDEAHIYKHKTREGAEAEAHRSAASDAKQETDRKRVITRNPKQHIEDHSSADYDNSAHWHTIRHRVITHGG